MRRASNLWSAILSLSLFAQPSQKLPREGTSFERNTLSFRAATTEARIPDISEDRSLFRFGHYMKTFRFGHYMKTIF